MFALLPALFLCTLVSCKDNVNPTEMSARTDSISSFSHSPFTLDSFVSAFLLYLVISDERMRCVRLLAAADFERPALLIFMFSEFCTVRILFGEDHKLFYLACFASGLVHHCFWSIFFFSSSLQDKSYFKI